MSAAAVKRIAKALRSEANIADRPGQMERLNALAEQVEALAPKPPKPPRPKVLCRAAVLDPKQIGHPWVTCVKVGDYVTSTYQTHGAIWEVLEVQEAFNSDRYGPLLRLQSLSSKATAVRRAMDLDVVEKPPRVPEAILESSRQSDSGNVY